MLRLVGSWFANWVNSNDELAKTKDIRLIIDDNFAWSRDVYVELYITCTRRLRFGGLCIWCVTWRIRKNTFKWNRNLSKTWKTYHFTIEIFFISENTFFIVVANWLDSEMAPRKSRRHCIMFLEWREFQEFLLYINQIFCYYFRSFPVFLEIFSFFLLVQFVWFKPFLFCLCFQWY